MRFKTNGSSRLFDIKHVYVRFYAAVTLHIFCFNLR